MFVIFLDIDGVLVTRRSMRESYELGKSSYKVFDTEAVSVLNTFIEKTKAKVVISSAWRMGQTVESMQEILTNNGVNCEVIGLTPAYPEDRRGLEIEAWLNINKDKWDDYLIIDDEIEDIKINIPQDKIIHVAHGLMNYGLTEQHLEKYFTKKI